MEQITLAGDWHGSTSHAAWVAQGSARRGIHKIFQVGDFGLWEHEPSGVKYLDDLEKLAVEHDLVIYCLGGNHDNEKLAFQLHGANFDADGFVLLRGHVRLAVRGHRWKWAGTTFLALGGAHSVDKEWRVASENFKTNRSRTEHEKYGKAFKDYTDTMWFPDEETTDENVVTAIGDGTPVHVMLTHDKPLRSTPDWNRKDLPKCHPNQERIQKVVDELHPELLVHGHLHHPYQQNLCSSCHGIDTQIVGLDADMDAMNGERGYDKDNSVAVLSLDGDLRTINFMGKTIYL
jgi:hypothetical protein